MLTEREREVLRLRFEDDLTQSEIGERVGVSQMHVSRLIRQSVARLREAPRTHLRRCTPVASPACSTGICARSTWSRTNPRCCTPPAARRARSRSQLPAGEELQEHEVHERAYLVVIDGEVEVERRRARRRRRPGFAAAFDPHERHTVRATSDARLLLVLAPWPGDGHPGARDT